jgi:hypothetical protein
MPYPTDQEIIAQAAAAGFAVGDYVHHHSRDHRAAGPIKSFSMCDGTLTVSWMDGAARCALSEVRLSQGHRRRAQFGEGYEFFTSPALIAQALHQVGHGEPGPGAPYRGVWVLGFGTDQAEVWATAQPRPSDAETAFMRLDPGPAAPELPAPDQALSPNVQLIIGSRLATLKAVEVQMKVTPAKAKSLFKTLEAVHGKNPTVLHLALFSGASDLVEMVRTLQAAGALGQ